MTEAPLTVVCVLRSGGAYGPEWVWALERGIREHLTNFQFRVITDFKGVFGKFEVPMAHHWPKWWSLVNWWKPGLFPGRVLAMGVDTLATGNLDQIATYDGAIAGISDFYHPAVLASGVMVWQKDAGADLYEAFRKDAGAIMRRFPRMDPWMRTVIGDRAGRLQDHFPGQIVSYKAHARAGVPAGARLVCGHGEPKFNNPKCGWANNWWKALVARGPTEATT